MVNKNKFLEVLLEYVITIIGRNRFGNVLHIKSCINLDERDLRYVEKVIYDAFKTRVTVFYSNCSQTTEVLIELDFDQKFPYDKYPLQNLLESGIK